MEEMKQQRNQEESKVSCRARKGRNGNGGVLVVIFEVQAGAVAAIMMAVAGSVVGCYVHDAACTNCGHWLCGWACVPDK